jgi:hypothetical protein
MTHTLPKPVLFALIFRLAILHLASRILPTIGDDSWEHESAAEGEEDEKPVSTLTRILLTYRQFIFITVYSHLLRKPYLLSYEERLLVSNGLICSPRPFFACLVAMV